MEFSLTLARRTVTITKMILLVDSNALLQNKKYFRNHKKTEVLLKTSISHGKWCQKDFIVGSEDWPVPNGPTVVQVYERTGFVANGPTLV